MRLASASGTAGLEAKTSGDDVPAALEESPSASGTSDGGADGGTTEPDSIAVDNIRAPTAEETDAIADAENERAWALAEALRMVNAMLAKQPEDDTDDGSGAPTLTPDDQRVLDTAGRWLYTPRLGAEFWDALTTARNLISGNQELSAQAQVDTATNDFAYVYGEGTVSTGIFFCMPFFASNSDCRREVVTHEYFHFLGLDHFYSTSQTSEALRCAHHMAEFVFDLTTGCVLGCQGTKAICRR